MFDFEVSLYFLMAQFVGCIGYGCAIVSTQFKNRNLLLFMEGFGCLIVALHWIMLEFQALAFPNIGYGLVCFLGIFREKYDFGRLLYFTAIPIVYGSIMMSWEGSLLNYGVLVAATCYLFARFCVDMLKLRFLSISSTGIWFIMNASSGSISGVICNISYFCGHLRQIYKLLKLRDRLKPVLQTA